MVKGRTILAGIGLLCGLAAFTAFAEAPAGDAKRGESLYNSICVGCHSLDANRAGPKHRGVFGRKAGGVDGYDYSPAVKRSGVTWNATPLNQWLASPEKFIPGQKMFFQVEDEKDRADIIAYLKSVS